MSEILTCIKYDAIASATAISRALQNGYKSLSAVYKDWSNKRNGDPINSLLSEYKSLNRSIIVTQGYSGVQVRNATADDRKRRSNSYYVSHQGVEIKSADDTLKMRLSERHIAIKLLKMAKRLNSLEVDILCRAPKFDASGLFNGTDANYYAHVPGIESRFINKDTIHIIKQLYTMSGYDSKVSIRGVAEIKDFKPYDTKVVILDNKAYIGSFAESETDVRFTVFDIEIPHSPTVEADVYLKHTYMDFEELVLFYLEGGASHLNYKSDDFGSRNAEFTNLTSESKIHCDLEYSPE